MLRLNRLFYAALGIAALLALPRPARAGLPDWLRAAARAPLPAYPEETSAAIVFEERTTTVKDNGDVETTRRRAIKILRPEGRDNAVVAVNFDSETRLTYLKGWSISARGDEYEMKEKDAIETSLYDESLYSDIRHKVLSLPGADTGAVIGYEYVQKQRPRILQDTWSFQKTIPVLRARQILQLPPGWEFEAIWLNHEEVKARSSGSNEWTWELENLPAVEHEPSMPAWESLAGRLALTFFSGKEKIQGKSHGSWREVGDWYTTLAGDRRQSTPAIEAKTREVIAAAPDSLEKIRALARFAQSDIRYVAIEIGIGGLQPHPAGEILANLYGDCKDKVTLLSTMLRVAGIESYYVLIHTDRGIVAPQFPTVLDFNHVILAIRLPQDADRVTLYSAMEHPKLGHLLYFDPTDPMTPLGYLPSSLQDNHGLLVTDEGGELVRLPLLAPSLNRLLRSATLTLEPDGSLEGIMQELRWGDHARRLRRSLTRSPASERAKVIEEFLGQFLTGVVFMGAHVEGLEDPGKPLVLQYRFRARNYAKSAGGLLILRPRVVGQKTREILEGKERKTPVEFDSASMETDMFDIALPAGYQVDELPAPFSADCGFADYKSAIKMEGRVLRYQRSMAIKSVFVPKDRLGELKTFYRQIAGDERNNAILKRQVP